MGKYWKDENERGEGVTEDKFILSLCREAGEGGLEMDLVKNFREKYRDQSELITNASLADSKALRRLRWLCGPKVITKLGIWEAQKE